jgi:hypothetical protein
MNNQLFFVNNTCTLFYEGDIFSVTGLSREEKQNIVDLLHDGDYTSIRDILDPNGSLVRNLDTDLFDLQNGSLYMKGIPVSIPETLAGPIQTDASLQAFWRLAALNPDTAARDNLFWFLDKYGYTITPEGYFVAYRQVDQTRTDGVFTDRHTGKMRIRLNEIVQIDRGLCDHRQGRTCSSGLHCASLDWLNSNSYWGSVPLAVLVNPMHVVAVPPLDSYGKLRVCQYYPVEILESVDGNIPPITPELVVNIGFSDFTIDQLNTMLTTLDLTGTVYQITQGKADLRGMLCDARRSILEVLVS